MPVCVCITFPLPHTATATGDHSSLREYTSPPSQVPAAIDRVGDLRVFPRAPFGWFLFTCLGTSHLDHPSLVARAHAHAHALRIDGEGGIEAPLWRHAAESQSDLSQGAWMRFCIVHAGIGRLCARLLLPVQGSLGDDGEGTDGLPLGKGPRVG